VVTGPVYHYDLVQGSTEWLETRCGLLTASEMKHILTPTLKVASNDKERAHVYALAAQRLAGYVEPGFTGNDMFRGHEDEIDARIKYAENYSPVEECGFITNDRWGFTIGYSPDGLVGDDGLIETKSRAHKFQFETIVEDVRVGKIPSDFVIQCQTGLLVSERKWLDFISYSAGLPMVTFRVFPDPVVQAAIIEAATAFEARVATKIAQFHETLAAKDGRFLATERRLDREIIL